MTLSTDEHGLDEADVEQVDPLDDAPALIDLFNDGPTLARYFASAIAQANFEDAYLFGAGLQQLFDDDCSTGREFFRQASTYLNKRTSSRARLGGMILQGIDQILAAAQLPTKTAHTIAATKDHLARYVIDLAAMATDRPTKVATQELIVQGALVCAEVERNIQLLRPSVLRLPSCFRSFDQRPQDVVALVGRFSAVVVNQLRPIAVVGVRTSGSYLAPLCVADLARRGYHRVAQVTIRPGWAIGRQELAVLRETVRAGGVIMMLDDPPTTGRSLEIVIEQLRRFARARRESIWILVSSFDDEPSATELYGVRCITLPYREWEIHRLCDPTAIAAALGVGVRQVIPLGAPQPTVRGHLTATFEVDYASREVEGTSQIAVEGVGLGYFGRHQLAVAAALPEYCPAIIGLSEGICLREHLPAGDRVDDRGDDGSVAADEMVGYIVARQQALGVDIDCTERLRGRLPAWEVASNIVGRVLGPLAQVLRPVVIDPVIRRVLRVEAPSVTDGQMWPEGWFWHGGHQLVKINFAEGPFSHLDLASYDARFDLAAAATNVDAPEVNTQLRATYTQITGLPVDAARWALLCLIQLWNGRRLGRRDERATRRSCSRVLQDFYSEVYLEDLPTPTGPFCAVDLDGVLETSTLGFPALTRSGALALRSLIAHDIRPLIASGRSRSEVAERCERYRAAGGVAEYGAFVICGGGKTAIDLVDPVDRERLTRLRELLELEADLVVDVDYEAIVRVYRIDSKGHRRGLSAEVADSLVARLDGSDEIVSVVGEEQTDFVPRAISKGAALCRLLHELDGTRAGADDARTETDDALALIAAIGDSWTDLSMLALAQFPFAPANATKQVRAAGVEVQAGSYQRGTAEAVARLVGHRVAGCAHCRPSDVASTDELLARLLSLQEGGVRRLPGRVLEALLYVVRDRIRR